MPKNFTVDRFSWHTSVPGNPETREQVIARLWSVTRFLQENGLTNRELAKGPESIDEAYGIHSSDLTERGLALMKQVYDKWLRRLDRGMSPEDLSLFEKALRDQRR